MDVTNAAVRRQLNKEHLIIALDVDRAADAKAIVSVLNREVGAFKIGLQLFTAAGPKFVREMVDAGARIFLDLKFHDIPNTVAGAGIEAARLGVWMFNVHALGGGEMLRRTAEAVSEVCLKENIVRPKMIAVTILTSSDQNTLTEVGINNEVGAQVLNLAGLTAECGLDGVVASPHEVRLIRESIGNEEFLIVTPGIRPGLATNDDQRRVMTPGEAVATGSDYLVIGRPVTKAPDMVAAVRKILEEA